MPEKTALVVTSIAGPNPILRQLAQGCLENGYSFIVIGDEASPRNFNLEGCRFYGLDEQRQLGFKFAELCPTRHYARKNIGYLVAVYSGATVIIETDDDNIPYERFWEQRTRTQSLATLMDAGWVNVYRYFSDQNIWPRGLPLKKIGEPLPSFEDLPITAADCPIQQGLTDCDPDVDAIYRLTMSLPLSFRRDRRVALKKGSWSPFNSQNTAWWATAFPLLYLPAYCSFRLTDIWRSFVAQRIAWTNGWSTLFHEPTCRQERNQHDLMLDFEGELPGYLHNERICEVLSLLPLKPGVEYLMDNVRACYEKLVEIEMVDRQELDLLAAWLEDLSQAGKKVTSKLSHVMPG